MTDTLPTFPDLEPIELCHLPEIRSMTARFPSYSDFNAVSLWTWNASGPYRIGQLHGNLVVEFSDYLIGEIFLSFIGDTEIAKTSLTLLEAARSASGLSDELRLVPEHTAEHLRGDPRFTLELEHDARDYLYSPQLTVSLGGGDLRPLRKHLHGYDRASSAAGGIEILEASPAVLKSRIHSIRAILDSWASGDTDGAGYSISERRAIDRLCESACAIGDFTDIRIHIATGGDEFFGFSVCEVANSSTIAAHFWKSDGRVAGLTTRFFMEIVRLGCELGVETINMQQDLGIPGLRTYKARLNPSGYLHKYRVSLADRIS